MERIYNFINEDLAKRSKGMWSFSDYKEGSATQGYQNECNIVYDLAEKVIQNKPEYKEKVEMLAYRYIEKLANWYNKKFSIDLMYPSQMICGAGNFNHNKHNKQQEALKKHFESFNEIEAIKGKISNIETQKEAIKSGDADAIEKLEAKLNELETLQKRMKETNAYFKKNNTLKGCIHFENVSQEKLQKLDDEINASWSKKPYESFQLTNNNAKIKNTKARIEQLKKAKEKGNTEVEVSTVEGNDLFKVVENTEIMRLQLIFDGKPESEVRDLLKSNGFKWSPKNGAWQRQLTDNARYSLKRLIEKLQTLQAS